ncbi:MAG: aminoacyl-tRNA hydrolase, partial [Microcoleus sp.]
IRLVAGLGNPGREYQRTRHNVGYLICDRVARHYKAGGFRPKNKFKADILELTLGGEKVIVAKPLTYYNNSGEAARAIIDFYQIDPSDVLVVHDELSLPFGTVRVRFDGSDAGNNGIKSLNLHIGQNYTRIRIGTAQIAEASSQQNHVDFVLGKFTKVESDKIEEMSEHVIYLIKQFTDGQLESHTTVR